MPKKHTPGYQTTKPQPVSHISLASTSKSSSTNQNAWPDNVNDRLAQLRVSQKGNTTTTTSTSSSSNQTSHPQLLDADGWPLTRPSRRNGRISGPPPPRSWSDYRSFDQGLEYSRYAPGGAKKGEHGDWSAGTSVYRPPPVLPDQPLSEPRSLRGMAMRVMAQTFHRQIEEKDWLVYELTGRMKSELVAVMVGSAPGGCGRLDEGVLQYLFGPLQEDDGSWVSGGEDATHLSLGPVMGNGVDYAQLSRNLRRTFLMEREEIPDSWDDTDSRTTGSEQPPEENEIGDKNVIEDPLKGTTQSLPKSIWLPLLPSLTHLSLARPHSASWSSLLDIAGLDRLCHLTHLDLSHWPAPIIYIPTLDHTLAPSPVDSQLEEIRILNRLGKACRELVWLGLEGCESWLSCLTATYHNPIARPRSRFDMGQTSRKDDFVQMDWTGVWRGLETVKIIQAWIPATLINAESLSLEYSLGSNFWLAESFRQWWDHEKRIRDTEDLVTGWRLQAGLPSVKFEKSPVRPWLEVQIRALEFDEAVMGFERPSVGGW